MARGAMPPDRLTRSAPLPDCSIAATVTREKRGADSSPLFVVESMWLAIRMSLLCLFGVHRPSLSSVARSPIGFRGLCDSCARPLERTPEGKWQASAPLDIGSNKAA